VVWSLSEAGGEVWKERDKGGKELGTLGKK